MALLFLRNGPIELKLGNGAATLTFSVHCLQIDKIIRICLGLMGFSIHLGIHTFTFTA